MLTEPLMTVPDIAEFLHLHVTTVYKLIRSGEIPAFRVGHDWRARPDAINAWLDERSRPPKPAQPPPC